jgi:hypothetical protein
LYQLIVIIRKEVANFSGFKLEGPVLRLITVFIPVLISVKSILPALNFNLETNTDHIASPSSPFPAKGLKKTKRTLTRTQLLSIY